MSSTTSNSRCSGPAPAGANWIEAGEPGGVNCTARNCSLNGKSMSRRHPRRW
jgi:hypothetical protein